MQFSHLEYHVLLFNVAENKQIIITWRRSTDLFCFCCTKALDEILLAVAPDRVLSTNTTTVVCLLIGLDLIWVFIVTATRCDDWRRHQYNMDMVNCVLADVVYKPQVYRPEFMAYSFESHVVNISNNTNTFHYLTFRMFLLAGPIMGPMLGPLWAPFAHTWSKRNRV